MIIECKDEESGAILFKENDDGLNIRALQKKIKELELRIEKLEKEAQS